MARARSTGTSTRAVARDTHSGSLAAQQDPRALLRRFIDDVINAQDLDGALVELGAEDFELNPLPGQRPGRAGLGGILIESRIIMDSPDYSASSASSQPREPPESCALFYYVVRPRADCSCRRSPPCR